MNTNFDKLSLIRKTIAIIAFITLAIMAITCLGDSNAPAATATTAATNAPSLPAPAIVPHAFDEDTVWQGSNIFHTHADTNGVQVVSGHWRPVVVHTNSLWSITFTTEPEPPTPPPPAPKPPEPSFIDGVRYGVLAKIRNPDLDDVPGMAQIAYRFWEQMQPKPQQLQSTQATIKK